MRRLTYMTILMICAGFTSLNANVFIEPEDPRPSKKSPEGIVASPLSSRAMTSYLWVKEMQHDNGLIESAENSNFVSLYDNALAAFVFMAQGDMKSAEKIFAYFDSKLQIEFQTGGGGFLRFRDVQGNNGRERWIGDNAWLLLAINHYHEVTGTQTYREMADALSKWLRAQQDTDGGLWGGYRENGKRYHKITEGIITAYIAVEGYDEFHKGILNYLKQQRWDDQTKMLVAWPEHPKYKFAMDLHSLGSLIFENASGSFLGDIERYKTTKLSTGNGRLITGYCFDADKDVVWLEGTAQIALALKQHGSEKDARSILKELNKSKIDGLHNSGTNGLPYATNQGSSYGAGDLWEHADKAPALSSTAWYLMASMNFNPFQSAQKKDIPAADAFWVQ